ncbi:stage II sporulation protein D [Solibacillus kalamii]|uniref:Stage II sporulation protein D n=2 Tax=Solibacillus kalamii TaxID=1748298 RepID=A0ABX3ZMD8_9BACL|nr:stage II sporulation protein D [Solibacillus kalamii]
MNSYSSCRLIYCLMKKIIIYFIIGVLLFLVPFTLKSKKQTSIPEQAESTSCPLFIKVNNTTVPIEDYLIGVIAGEMPASFHMEALKAQAIASRTYVLKQTNYGKKPILTTTAHQVYNDQELREEKWKTTFAENEEKITEAVNQTANQILTYNDELITAMFHASSFQYTESAENYSGNPIPYLTATTSPEQLNQEQTTYTFEELNKNLKQNFSRAQLQNAKLKRNNTNRIEQITIHKKTWTGREMRTLLNLRSTNFTWEPTAAGITIKTYGYGHGVGMSQYGADAMAQGGLTAEGILSHYYPSTTLKSINYCKK